MNDVHTTGGYFRVLLLLNNSNEIIIYFMFGMFDFTSKPYKYSKYYLIIFHSLLISFNHFASNRPIGRRVMLCYAQCFILHTIRIDNFTKYARSTIYQTMDTKDVYNKDINNESNYLNNCSIRLLCSKPSYSNRNKREKRFKHKINRHKYSDNRN